jgi:hypothetical protein
VQLYESLALLGFLTWFVLMLERNRERTVDPSPQPSPARGEGVGPSLGATFPSPLAGEGYEGLAQPKAELSRSWVRGRSAPSTLIYRSGFYALVGFYAVQRFVWEFLKPYPRVLGPFDIFHFLMLGLLAYSLCMLWGERRRHEQAGQRTTGAETLSA